MALLQVCSCRLAGLGWTELQVLGSGQAHRAPGSSDTSWLPGAYSLIMMAEMQEDKCKLMVPLKA